MPARAAYSHSASVGSRLPAPVEPFQPLLYRDAATLIPRANANLGRTNVSPTTFGPGARDLDRQTRDARRRPRRGQILATPLREQQARTRAAGMMPTARHRYGPILGQILCGNYPKVPVKARRTSVRQDQLQIRRPSPDELGTGPPRLPRAPMTRRHHGWRSSAGHRRRRVVRQGEVLAETDQVFRFWGLTYRRPPREGDPRGRT